MLYLYSGIHFYKIKFIILSHPDPDLASSTPLFEKNGVRAQIVTHWRSANMIKYYGIRSPFYLIDEHQYELTLKSGRKLSFILSGAYWKRGQNRRYLSRQIRRDDWDNFREGCPTQT